jgi:hypothetical protein
MTGACELVGNKARRVGGSATLVCLAAHFFGLGTNDWLSLYGHHEIDCGVEIAV